MYEETYKLFSHRPDIKAKHSHIYAKPKSKAKVKQEYIDTLISFLTMVIYFVTIALILSFWV